MLIKKNSFYQYSILDELKLIDWEKDTDSTDQGDGSEKEDSLLEISDSDSCTNTNSLPVKEENDELCKVRNCSEFKKKSCCYNYGICSYLFAFELGQCVDFAYLIFSEQILYHKDSRAFSLTAKPQNQAVPLTQSLVAWSLNHGETEVGRCL